LLKNQIREDGISAAPVLDSKRPAHIGLKMVMINTLLSGVKSVGFDKSSSCAAERPQEILLFFDRMGSLIVQLCVSGIFVNINYLNADFNFSLV
jgi:hypothetical protein